MISKIKKLIEKLPFFKKKEPPKPEFIIPKSWESGKLESFEEITSNPTLQPATKSIETLRPTFTRPVRGKIRVPFLLKFKRILAGFLFLVSVVVGFGSLFMSGAEVASLLFIPNAFLLLDYLWKTKTKKREVFSWGERVKEVKVEKEETHKIPDFCESCGTVLSGKPFCPNCGMKVELIE